MASDRDPCYRPARDPNGDAVGPFLYYLLSECGLSPNTLAAYRSDLMKFSQWRKTAAPGPLAEIDVPTLAGYVDHLTSLGLSPPSVGRHLASLSTYFRYLIYEGKLGENTAKLLSAPSLWDRLPTVLGPPAVERLLESPDPATPLGLRDRAALETLYATGCRASEVVGLKPSDLDFKLGLARCVGKGDKERVVPLGTRAREALQRYISESRPVLVRRNPTTAQVFVTRRGQ
ncbi:MAG: tyrosine-type recombinase/integrase, partial [Isosphaeraceae bacterium]